METSYFNYHPYKISIESIFGFETDKWYTTCFFINKSLLWNIYYITFHGFHKETNQCLFILLNPYPTRSVTRRFQAVITRFSNFSYQRNKLRSFSFRFLHLGFPSKSFFHFFFFSPSRPRFSLSWSSSKVFSGVMRKVWMVFFRRPF